MGIDQETKFTCDRCGATDRKLDHAFELDGDYRRTFSGNVRADLHWLPKDWHFIRLATGEWQHVACLCGGCTGVVKDALLPSKMEHR